MYQKKKGPIFFQNFMSLSRDHHGQIVKIHYFSLIAVVFEHLVRAFNAENLEFKT